MSHSFAFVALPTVSSAEADTIYVDDDTSCLPPESDCCVPDGGLGPDCGDCNVPRKTSGCSDPDCEAIVCDADSDCDPNGHAGQLLSRGHLLQEKL